jgi:hypothetical protein
MCHCAGSLVVCCLSAYVVFVVRLYGLIVVIVAFLPKNKQTKKLLHL